MKTEFLGNGYCCCTDKNNKITYDPLLLAYFSKPAGRMIDLCCGNGIIALLLHKKGCRDVTGTEIDAEAIRLAKEGAERSGVKIDFIKGDIKKISEFIKCGDFDAVTVNPPYFRGKGPSDGRKAEIRNEGSLTLEEAVGAAAYAVKAGGHIYICHRPERENDVVKALRKHGFFPHRILTVADSCGKKPFLVLFDAADKECREIKKDRMDLKVDGEYTNTAKNIFFPKGTD